MLAIKERREKIIDVFQVIESFVQIIDTFADLATLQYYLPQNLHTLQMNVLFILLNYFFNCRFFFLFTNR